jgi:hypothetical protein
VFFASLTIRVAFYRNLDSIAAPFNSSTNDGQPNPLGAIDNAMGMLLESSEMVD